MRVVGRFFSGRGKSPVRNATETAVFFAAIEVAIYAPADVPIWRLVVGAFAVGLVGFVIGFGFTKFNERRGRNARY